MPTLLRTTATAVLSAVAVLSVAFGAHAQTATQASVTKPSGSDLPPLSEFIGTDSFTELGEVDVKAVEALLDDIEISEGVADQPYERSAFGPAWADTDGNGCGTRDDILTRDLVRVAVDEDCVVQSGTLHDIFTGKEIDFVRGVGTSNAVQIDHMVSLSAAWHQGASEWDDERRLQFANDPTNLTAIDGPTNGSKSDSGPGEWLPPNEDYHCTYVARYTYVAADWGLTLPQADVAAITAELDSCKNAAAEQPTLTPTPPTAEPTAIPTPTEQPSTPAPPTVTPTSIPSPTEDEEDEVEPMLTISPDTIDAADFGNKDGGVTIRVEGLTPGQVATLEVKPPTERIDEFSVELTANDDGIVEYTVHALGTSYPGVYGVTVTSEGAQLSGTFTVTGDITDLGPQAGSDEGHREDLGANPSGDRLPRTGPGSVAAGLILGGSLVAAGTAAVVGARRARLS